MPRIIGETLEDHRKKTRQQLFDALSRLLQTSTFESLTMAKIAQEAGVGRTAVYNHFQDKEALLLAFIAYETGQYSVRLNRALAGVSSPIKMLRIYIREQLTLGSSYHLAPGLDLRRQVSNETSSELHLHAQIVENILRQILRKAINEGTLPPQNLPVAISMVNASLAGRSLPKDPIQREYLIHCIQAYVLRSLGASHTLAPLPNAKRFLGRRIDLDENPFTSRGGEGMVVSACPIHRAS